jgi:DNA replication protein DnaC
MTSQNTERLNQLGLGGMATALDRQRGLPAFMGLGFDERLSTLIDAENSTREDRRLKRILKLAKLKTQAMPEDIDFRNGRGLDRAMVADLLTCDWVERGRNGIITGPCGAGKTWLTCALGMQAARNGFPVLYHRVSLLLESMALAHQDGSISKLRATLAKAKLLILDDFGLSRFSPRGKQDLLEILDARVGSQSTIIAGQLPFQDWHDHIDEPALADAILDRIMHTSFRIEMAGESMRRLKAGM